MAGRNAGHSCCEHGHQRARRNESDSSGPQQSGFDLLVAWRAAGRQMPVILLSARDALADRVSALERGAQDYLVKPFAIEELLARIGVQLRRGDRSGSANTLTLGECRVDLGRAVLHQDGAEIPLTTQEAQLLAYLAVRPGQAVSRQALLQAVWGFQTGHVRSRAVDNTVYRLRAKLEQRPAAPRHLITVRRLGYRLEV